jgi:hypothetical protein
VGLDIEKGTFTPDRELNHTPRGQHWKLVHSGD